MKLTINTDYALEDLSDRERLRLIIELINHAPNAQEFQDKVIKTIQKMEID